MSEKKLQMEHLSDREIVSSRVLNAPRDLVFEAFSNPDHLAHWWGPEGFTNTFSEFDLRPGGAWRFIMHGPDGKDYQNNSVFVEIVKPERIVFEHLGPMHRFQMTMTFVERSGKTELIWRMIFESEAEALNVKGFILEANEQNFDRLAAYLTRMDREILSVRVFDAPRELVWRAWTEPEHLKQWWGPNGFTNTFHEFDFKPEGVWRFIMHGPDGTDYKNKSVFVEILKPERIVFDHVSGPKFRASVTFEEIGGKTKVVWRMLFETAAAFDAVKGFAIEGNRQNLDKLEAHLATMA